MLGSSENMVSLVSCELFQFQNCIKYIFLDCRNCGFQVTASGEVQQFESRPLPPNFDKGLDLPITDITNKVPYLSEDDLPVSVRLPQTLDGSPYCHNDTQVFGPSEGPQSYPAEWPYTSEGGFPIHLV